MLNGKTQCAGQSELFTSPYFPAGCDKNCQMKVQDKCMQDWSFLADRDIANTHITYNNRRTTLLKAILGPHAVSVDVAGSGSGHRRLQRGSSDGDNNHGGTHTYRLHLK